MTEKHNLSVISVNLMFCWQLMGDAMWCQPLKTTYRCVLYIFMFTSLEPLFVTPTEALFPTYPCLRLRQILHGTEIHLVCHGVPTPAFRKERSRFKDESLNTVLTELARASPSGVDGPASASALLLRLRAVCQLSDSALKSFVT